MEGTAQKTENTVVMMNQNTQDSNDALSLQESVNQSLQQYITTLDGQTPANLYSLVLAEVEKPLLEMVLKLTNGNQSKAAIILGISRGTLRKKMAIYDHLDPDNQVKIYDRGVSIVKDKEERYKTLIQYRIGDMYAPKVDQTEPLETVCQHFIECIQKKKKPLTDGKAGLRVVALLEKAQKSIDCQGKLIKV